MDLNEASTWLQIDHGQCIGCAICVDVCHDGALAMAPNDLHPLWLPERCTACAECVQECPAAAIVLGLEPAAPAP